MNLSKKIYSYIKITRPINVLITFLVVIVAILISQINKVGLSVIIISSLAAALITAGGNVINDIFDIETDKIAHPDRVLINGTLSKKEAALFYNLLNAIAIILASRISIQVLLIAFLTIILLFVYSKFLKKLPLIGNFVIAFLTGLAFIYGGFVSKNPVSSIIPAIFAFLINFIREVVKDIQDIEGDKRANLKTFPIKYGIPKSSFVIIVLTILLIAFTAYPFFANLFRIEYLIVVMLVVNPILVLCLKHLFDKSGPKLSMISNLLKLDMIIGLIAIYLGK
jgi:geranylgeranylglycerol-phosphate geranylgeranyltransferase